MTTQSNNQQEVLKETKITVDDKMLDQNGKLQSANVDNIVKSLLQVNPSWLRFFNSKSLSPDTVNTAIETNPLSIQWVKNPSEEQKSLAVTNNPIAFRFIKNPSRAVIDDTLFSPNVNSGNSERVWDMVSPRVNKFDDETAKKIAQSPLYAKQAYDDRGIAFTNSRVKKGLFGGEKTVGGDLINPHKYNIFSKAAKKLRGYTPDSVLGSDDTLLKALKARGNTDTASQINAINAELGRRNKGEVSPDKVLSGYSSGALNRILDGLYTQQASKAKGTEQKTSNFEQIPPVDTKQISVQPVKNNIEKPTEPQKAEAPVNNQPEQSQTRTIPAQFERKSMPEKNAEPKSSDAADVTTLTADQAVRDAQGNVIHDTIPSSNQPTQAEEPAKSTLKVDKTDQSEIPTKPADSNENIKRTNKDIQDHLDALWALKDENKFEELKKYIQTNQTRGYFKKALALFDRNVRKYNSNEQRNYVRAQNKANTQSNETTGKKILRSSKGQLQDMQNAQKTIAEPVTATSADAQSIDTDTLNVADAKPAKNSAKISKEDEKKKQERIAYLKGQLRNNLASYYTNNENQSNESRNSALAKIKELEELSPEEYKAGFDYIANTFIPTKNTTTNSIKSYIKGLEDFYPEGLESFKDRLKDNKKFIAAWNELHPDQKIETKQNIQGKPIIQSPQSQLKNSEAKQQNKEKPSEQTINQDDEKLEKLNIDAINKSLDETKKVLSSKDLNLNNAVTLGKTALKLTNGLTDPDKILLAKKIFEENKGDNKNLMLSQHILQNQVRNLELANIANTLNQNDKNAIKDLIRNTNEDAVNSLDEIIYDIITTKEPDDDENINPAEDIEENINDVFKQYDSKTINNLKKISNIIKKQLPEIEYPQLFDYIENYKL